MFQKLPSFFVGNESYTTQPHKTCSPLLCHHQSSLALSLLLTVTLALSRALPLNVLFVLRQKAYLFVYPHTTPCPSLPAVYVLRCIHRQAWTFIYSSSSKAMCFCFLSPNPNDIILLGNHHCCSSFTLETHYYYFFNFNVTLWAFPTDPSQPKHKPPFTLTAMLDIRFEVSPKES